MIRTTLFASAAAFCLAPLAHAEHQNSYGYNSYQSQYNSACAREKDDNRLVGGLIGAVAGGALGVAIADDNDGHRRHRSRGYGRRGHGYRGHRRHHRHRGGGDGDEIAGALIGGILGAVVGSELAGSSTDCRTTGSISAPRYNYSGVPAPTRDAYGPAWNSAPNTPPPQPAATYPNAPDSLAGGPEIAPQAPQEPIRITPDEAVSPDTLQCTVMQRETRQADGTITRDPVSLCQMPDGTWQIQEDDTLY